MPIPAAEPGLVVRYDYLWHRRSSSGARTADKERPACVVLTQHREDGGTRVLLLPITHSPPQADQAGIEIPPKVKQHLGLDRERSWVVVSEANLDLWPSPDLKSLPGAGNRFDYGFLPPRLFRMIRDAFVDAHRARRARIVKREL